MSIKYNKMYAILTVILMAVGVASCSDDSNVYNIGNQQEYIKQTFEGMKGTYAGNLTMPDNCVYTTKFVIDDMANLKISSFPMDRILNEVYKGDYLNVKMSGDAVSFSCPIDSVGFSGGYMTFVTKNDYVSNVIRFSFTKDETQHSGYAFVTVKGYYDPTRKWVNVNYIVTDLIVDGRDYSSEACPLNHNFEANRQ